MNVWTNWVMQSRKYSTNYDIWNPSYYYCNKHLIIYHFFFFQTIRCRWSKVRTKEMDSLFWRRYCHHILCCNVRIWSSITRGWNYSTYIFVLYMYIGVCICIHILSWSNYSKHSFFCIESNARKFETVWFDLQQQVVWWYIHHSFPQQERSLWRKNIKIFTYHLFCWICG